MRPYPRPRERSVVQLAGAAVNELTAIATKEVKLVRAEISERLSDAVSGLIWMTASLALLIPAVTGLLIGLGMALGTIEGVPVWGGILIVSVLAGLVGALLVKTGKDYLDPSNILTLKKSKRNIRRDAKAVTEAAQ